MRVTVSQCGGEYEFSPIGADNLAVELKKAAADARDNIKAERRLLSMDQLDRVEGMLRGGVSMGDLLRYLMGLEKP